MNVFPAPMSSSAAMTSNLGTVSRLKSANILMMHADETLEVVDGVNGHVDDRWHRESTYQKSRVDKSVWPDIRILF